MPKHNENKRLYRELLLLAQELTKNSLQDGIDESVIKPVLELVKQSVTSGGSVADLTALLKDEILGNPAKEGRLARYAGQITRDALNQFNANYQQAASNDLGFEFYTYQGAIQNNSRDYCKRRVEEGRWFHIEEIKLTADESWSGKIPYTNGSNILIHRGGYNCNHQYIPVNTLTVPNSVIERARSKGYYKEK